MSEINQNVEVIQFK